MLIWSLFACIRLQEGDYDLDYSLVKVDSCDIYGGGQALDDTRGELSWDDADTLVFEVVGADDDLEFEVDGVDFRRETSGRAALDSGCTLVTHQEDEGEMLSNTEFEGTTTLEAELDGSCTVWQYVFDAPCFVEFDWDAEYDD